MGPAKPSQCPFHPPTGQGLSHRQNPRSRIKALEGCGPGLRSRRVQTGHRESRGLERGGDLRGEQCLPRSGSRLLASGGFEGELVLELQQ
jgi:hypothetical protein